MSESIRTIGKHGVEMQEYKGEFSLISVREGQDGKFYQQWARYRMGKEKYADKDWPIKVSLGDRATAAAVLQLLLKQVLGEDPAIPPTDDEPF